MTSITPLLLHDLNEYFGTTRYYGVAMTTRLLKIIGLFYKRAPKKRPYSALKRPMILRSLLIVATP